MKKTMFWEGLSSLLLKHQKNGRKVQSDILTQSKLFIIIRTAVTLLN